MSFHFNYHKGMSAKMLKNILKDVDEHDAELEVPLGQWKDFMRSLGIVMKACYEEGHKDGYNQCLKEYEQ